MSYSALSIACIVPIVLVGCIVAVLFRKEGSVLPVIIAFSAMVVLSCVFIAAATLAPHSSYLCILPILVAACPIAAFLIADKLISKPHGDRAPSHSKSQAFPTKQEAPAGSSATARFSTPPTKSTQPTQSAQAVRPGSSPKHADNCIDCNQTPASSDTARKPCIDPSSQASLPPLVDEYDIEEIMPVRLASPSDNAVPTPIERQHENAGESPVSKSISDNASARTESARDAYAIASSSDLENVEDERNDYQDISSYAATVGTPVIFVLSSREANEDSDLEEPDLPAPYPAAVAQLNSDQSDDSYDIDEPVFIEHTAAYERTADNRSHPSGICPEPDGDPAEAKPSGIAMSIASSEVAVASSELAAVNEQSEIDVCAASTEHFSSSEALDKTSKSEAGGESAVVELSDASYNAILSDQNVEQAPAEPDRLAYIEETACQADFLVAAHPEPEEPSSSAFSLRSAEGPQTSDSATSQDDSPSTASNSTDAAHDFESLADKAESFKSKGLYDIAARFYREAAEYSPDADRSRSLLFSALSCYMKSGNADKTKELIDELKLSPVLTKSERMKLQAAERVV